MRRTPRPVLGLAIVTTVLGLVLAACGTTQDTSAPSLTITSQTSATSATYHLKGTTSDNVGATKITYAVDGGPTQTVALTSSTFDVTVTLKAGQNSIGVTVYDAAGNTKTVTFIVTYSPPATTGALTVTITGTPSGVAANVHVTGPGLDTTVAATTTLTSLAPGTYTVTPNDVADAPYTYGGTPQSPTVDVSAGATFQDTVVYAAVSGAVDASVTGLPTGTQGSVTLTEQGGKGSSYFVKQSTLLADVTPGTYDLQVPDVFAGNGEWYSGFVLTANPLAVQAGPPAASLSVTYKIISGDLDITISGAPSAHVLMTDRGATYGYYVILTASQVQKGLKAAPTGTIYDFTPSTVSDGTYHYDAAAVSATLKPGLTVPVSATYGPTDGAIAITWSGSIPGTASYGATVTDAGGASQHVSASSPTTTLVPYLAAGTASVTPDPFTVCVNHQQTLYSGTVSPTSAPSISKGATYPLTIQYSGTVLAGAPPC